MFLGVDRRLRPTVVAGAVIACAACGASSSEPGTARTAPVVRVVSSTNVYADIAASIGGSHVDVTSFIDKAEQDPHSYEASAQNQLAVKKADVVIKNGGGYDDFMNRLVSAASSHAAVLDAVGLSGYQPSDGGQLNEHVWYDVPTMKKVVDATVTAMAAADPGDAGGFRDNGASLQRQLDKLASLEAATHAAHAGEPVGITELVPGYLLQADGLVNRTPAAFSEAVEEGSDVSPVVLADTLRLYADHEVKVLVYNAQTSGPTTEQVKRAAEQHGIPVVPVTETMPQGTHYVAWMTATIDAVDRALSSP